MTGTPFTATYRLQMNAGFTLADAQAIVPYLERLGISHLYLSPILAARQGSTHGYDVVDPTCVNPEIGGEDELRALSADVHRRGMGILLDIVPNHMGVSPANPYWEDLLRHGEHAEWAHWFDVDWDATRDRATGRAQVVLPVLGDELDALLARGELKLAEREGQLRVTYHESSWPVDPGTITPELEVAQLDPESVRDPEDLLDGARGAERLRALLERQHYRLVFWRRGPQEINYRRFFDINDLVALRMEDERVFAETHALVVRWIEEGVIDGLRIDHVDGLLDPLAYLRRLRAALDGRSEGRARVPIYVEKILSPGESLRESWPVDGTTGYDYLNDLEELFIAPAGFASMERRYRDHVEVPAERDFEAIAYEAKRAILDGALAADVARVVRLLRPVANALPGDERSDDALRAGVVHFICGLPVYRTYIASSSEDVHPDDRAVIERAIEHVGRHAPEHVRAASFVRDVLLGDGRGHDGWLAFVEKLQQVSGPATAKGVEDTALYAYVPLASRNEVGGAPDRPLADAVARLHAANAERLAHWPCALLATNTHDTKRSADARARLDVLAEVPDEWWGAVGRWHAMNAAARTAGARGPVPDASAEYLLYETLVGIWPYVEGGVPDARALESLRGRLTRYMQKAVREAKLRTSWTEPDAAYEKAIERFIAAIITPERGDFLRDLGAFVARVVPAGWCNAIARVVVQLTSPGVPDTYRGDEVLNLALVDPDNRARVDFDWRERELLKPLDSRRLDDPALKIGVVQRLLALRRSEPKLFAEGTYQAVELTGSGAAPAFSFVRRITTEGGERACLVVARRLPLTASLDGWKLQLPQELVGRGWRSVLWGESADPVPMDLRSLLGQWPATVLMSVG